MKTKFILIAVILTAMCINNANAQLRHRSQIQKQRIKQGVRSGELTSTETANLVHDRNQIRQDLRLARSDGKVTKDERRIIKKEVNHGSRKISRKRHNKWDRN